MQAEENGLDFAALCIFCKLVEQKQRGPPALAASSRALAVLPFEKV
jgi:hypothetical protein